jgi:hypothetical protein
MTMSSLGQGHTGREGPVTSPPPTENPFSDVSASRTSEFSARSGVEKPYAAPTFASAGRAPLTTRVVMSDRIEKIVLDVMPGKRPSEG